MSPTDPRYSRSTLIPSFARRTACNFVPPFFGAEWMRGRGAAVDFNFLRDERWNRARKETSNPRIRSSRRFRAPSERNCSVNYTLGSCASRGVSRSTVYGTLLSYVFSMSISRTTRPLIVIKYAETRYIFIYISYRNNDTMTSYAWMGNSGIEKCNDAYAMVKSVDSGGNFSSFLFLFLCNMQYKWDRCDRILV